MPRWYESAVESAFKPVAGGYIAKLPGASWVRSQCYVVNDAQKAEIAAVLGRQRLVMLCAVPLFTAGGGAIGWLSSTWQLTPGAKAFGLAALVLVMGLTFGLVTVGYVRHKLRPLLPTLQPSDQNIAVTEQVETVARRIAAPVLIVGLICGVIMVVVNTLMILHAMDTQRHLGTQQVFQSFSAVGGFLLSAYFIWLMVLRMRMNGQASR